MNQILLWNDMTVFWGKNPKAVSGHSHPMIQLVVATEGHFTSKSPSGEWIPKTGLLIAPNHLHECDARNVPILSVDIDPESATGHWVHQNLLVHKEMIDFPEGFFGLPAKDRFERAFEEQNWQEVRQLIESLFGMEERPSPPEKDDRMQAVLEYIDRHIQEPISTKDLMGVAHLSESRLLHLFKETMGLPVRNYILWLRIKIALTEITNGNSLTRAAYAAGFSDQAHLSRTCVRMLGLPPSVIARNSKFVQVSFPT